MERRSAVRIQAQWLARAKRLTKGHADGRLEDVSARGLRFVSPIRLRPNEPVEMDVRIGPRCFFRCRVRIVRRARSARAGRSYAARYEELSGLDAKILLKCLQRLAMENHVPPIALWDEE